MARFWFKNNRIREKLIERLQQIPCGRFLTKEDLIKNRCNFPHDKYGNLIWVADPGTVIIPNFWNGTKPPKGMHGYLPIDDNCQGKMIINSSLSIDSKIKKVRLVDIFPTLLDFMKLPIPPSSEGKSLLVKG